MKGSLVETDYNSAFPDGQKLQPLVVELESLVDAQKTRLDLSQEEATHFRTSYNDIKKEYDRLKVQFEQLAQKFADTETSTSMNQETKGASVKPPRIAKMPSMN